MESGRIIVSSNAKFYEYNSVPETSRAYTEQCVSNTLINSSTIEPAGGADAVDTEAAVDTNSKKKISNYSKGLVEELLHGALLEAEINVRRSGRQRQPLLKLTYKNALTGDNDADMTYMFAAHEPSNHEGATVEDDFNNW